MRALRKGLSLAVVLPLLFIPAGTQLHAESMSVSSPEGRGLQHTSSGGNPSTTPDSQTTPPVSTGNSGASCPVALYMNTTSSDGGVFEPRIFAPSVDSAGWQKLQAVLNDGISQCRAFVVRNTALLETTMAANPEYYNQPMDCSQVLVCMALRRQHPELIFHTRAEFYRYSVNVAIDDCLGHWLSHGQSMNGNSYESFGFTSPSPLPILSKTNCASWGGCKDFIFGVDQSGTPLTTLPADINECVDHSAAFDIDGSPISLLFSEENIEKDPTIVKFDLKPGSKQSYFVWKASEQAPLLVYNPEHSTSISSGSQLFGSWTMGGKAENTSNKKTAWADGFEVLKSLDKSGDGILAGEELKNIELWFDKNRNAKSEAGELRSLTSVGITKLYTHTDKKDERTGSITAELGFERVVSGKIITGKAVDWFSVGGVSEQEVLNSLVEKGSLKTSALIKDSDATLQTISAGFNGVWKYDAEVPGLQKVRKIQGVLTLETEGASVKGHSYTPVTNRPRGLASGSETTLVGRSLDSVNTESAESVTWKIGKNLQSKVNYDPVKDMLHGISTFEDEVGGQRIRQTYSWVARRL